MNYKHRIYRALVAGSLAMGLAACASNGDQVIAGPDFRDCQTGALKQVESASRGNSAALYHVAAESLSYCVGTIDASADPSADKQAIMQTQALAVTHYFKAGDVTGAKQALDDFRDQFIGQDLYFADGSSFIDNMSLLLGELPGRAARRGSLTNANAVLKSEIRRVQYWQHH